MAPPLFAAGATPILGHEVGGNLGILLTSLRAVGTMVVMAMGGVFLNQKGVMTPQVSKGLSEISMSLTIPCLLFTTAIDCTQNRSTEQCPRLTDLLRDGWPMLLLPAFYVAVGLLVGAVAARLGGAKDDFRRSAIAAVAFGNSTGLPVTLLAIIHAQFGKDTELGMLNPVLFLSVYLVPYPVLQWSVGSWLLQPHSAPACAAGDTPRSPNSVSPAVRESVLQLLAQPEPPIGTLMPEGWAAVQAAERHSFAHGRADRVELEARAASWHGGSPNTEPSATYEEPLTTAAAEGRAASKRGLRTVVRRVFPPPVIAALLGMLVALLEPVRAVLVDTRGRDGDAPLEWMFDGLAKIGAAAVPINMLILGNSVAKGARRSISARTAIAVAVAKLVVMPVIGLLTGLAMKSVGLVRDGPDAAFYLVTMLVTATPTANNIMVMAELAGENKEGLGTCIFVQYLLCPVVLTVWLAIYVSVATS